MPYIWERAEWPDLRWDERVVAARLPLLRHAQGRLIGRIDALGFDLKERARLQILTEDAVKTSDIEGERLDYASVRSSLARRLGIDIGALAPEDRAVEGIVEITLDATRGYAERVTAERLFGWHAALFPAGRSGLTRIGVGRWRDDASGPMRVVSGPIGRETVHFEAPPAARVAGEMTRFLRWLNARPKVDPIVKAALAHFRFVTVHPFDDGNGRIARAIADLALARADGSEYRFYSMSAQIRAERRAYYDVLERSQKGTLDVTAWLAWFLDCLGRAVAGSGRTLEAVLFKAEFWRRHAGDALNPRQVAILNRLLDGFEGRLTSSKWAKLAKCSQDTAGRDIADLVARGILAKGPEGGRSTGYALARRPL